MNPASGNHDAAHAGRLADVARDHGADLARTISFPDELLPSPSDLDSAGIDMLLVHTGDGTINAVAAALAGWSGALLVLPGGTLNLLARRLHGDALAEDILIKVLTGPVRIAPVPMVAGIDSDTDIAALVGVIAGPTTAWGDVRETLRRRDIAGLATAVPRAVNATFGGNQVRLADGGNSYPAIYAEPFLTDESPRLRLLGFLADGAGELFRHGFAWLGGDFRNGPHDLLGEAEQVRILCDGDAMGLLVDGERGHEGRQLSLRAVDSPVAFVATLTERPAEAAR